MISILPFGLVSVLFDSLDYLSFIKTLYYYVSTAIYCNYIPNFLKKLPKAESALAPAAKDTPAAKKRGRRSSVATSK